MVLWRLGLAGEERAVAPPNPSCMGGASPAPCGQQKGLLLPPPGSQTVEEEPSVVVWSPEQD